jgi:hypothetical protein
MMLKPSDTALFQAGAAPAEADREARAATARSDAARGADRQELLQTPRLLPGAVDARAAAGAHSLSVTSAYGDVLASEEVPATEFASALRRFYNLAIQHANAVVILDGITHTRNSFLEFVRAFNDCAARCAQLQAR